MGETLRFYESVSSLEMPGRSWWMALCFATLSLPPGLLAARQIRSTEHRPAYCFVTRAGLECYRPDQRLPTDSSADLADCTITRHTTSHDQIYKTVNGLVQVTPTCSSRYLFRLPSSEFLPVPPMSTYARHFTVSIRSLGASESTGPASLIFRDGFETGDLRAWSSYEPNEPPEVEIIEPPGDFQDEE